MDTYCTLPRQLALMQAIRKYSDLGKKALALEVPVRDVTALASKDRLARVKFEEDFEGDLKRTLEQMDDEFRKLEVVS